MSPARPVRSHFALEVAVATAIGLIAVAIPVLVTPKEPQPSASPPPRTGIVAKAKDVSIVPAVTDARKRSTVDGIGHDLGALYTRAFVRPGSAPEPSPTPAPKPSSKVAKLFTERARKALAADPSVFDEISDLSVYTGTVTFSGLVTFDGAKAINALLEIDFAGEATPVARNSPRAKVRQVGTIRLKRGENVWLVDGFDLKLGTRPLVTPSPSPA